MEVRNILGDSKDCNYSFVLVGEKMKKIAIITYHRAKNFGAKLQAYALQNILSQRFDTYILDYRCDMIESVYYPKESVSIRLRKLVKRLVKPKISKELEKRNMRFIEFDKRFRLSDSYNSKTVHSAKTKFDAFIAGSDQVWNPLISGGDDNYFLAFAYDRQKYSYAASFGGKTTITDEMSTHVAENLKGFQSLLVREQSGADYINYLNLDRKPYVTLDPIFLIDRSEWLNTFGISRNQHYRKYILVYFVAQRQQTNALAFAKKLSDESGMKIIYINAGNPIDKKLIYRNDVDPVLFLRLIYNAYCVVTTSFHAEAFSILFNVPFMYELTKTNVNTNDRLSELAQMFELKGQEIVNADTIVSFDIDWEKINSKIQFLRKKSLDILFKSLRDI